MKFLEKMPLHLCYTMVQKSKKGPKTQNKGYLTVSLCPSYLAHFVLYSLPNSTHISHMTSYLLALHNYFSFLLFTCFLLFFLHFINQVLQFF